MQNPAHEACLRRGGLREPGVPDAPAQPGLGHISNIARQYRTPSLGPAPPRPTIISRQSLPLYHNPLVAYVDKRLELLNQLVLLYKLRLESVDLLLAFLLHLVEFLLRFAQLAPEVGPDPFLRRRMRLAVYRRSILREGRLDFLRVPVDRCPGVVYVSREDRGVGVFFLQDLESLADPDTWTWLGQ